MQNRTSGASEIALGVSWRPRPNLPEPHAAALLRLLEAIARSGSLKAAAQAVGLSYRHAWGLLREAARSLGAPLVELRRGRGARPTALGQRLLWADNLIRERLEPELARLRGEIEAGLARALPARTPRLLLHATHDLAVAELARLCRPQLDLEVRFRGSEECLAALARGECDVAGFHVADALPRAAAAAAALGRWLDPRRHALIHFVTREQGILARPGLHIRGLHDLARSGLRFIHRQGGAGRRGGGRASLAAAVAEARADAAFGLKAEALRDGLDFVPLAFERYYFAATRARLATPALEALLKVLRGPELGCVVARLPGYDAARAGARETLAAALDWIASSRGATR